MTNNPSELREAVALLLCPFCGRSDLRVAYLRASADCQFWRVECANVDCDASTMGPTADTEEKAIAAWNTRAPQVGGGDWVLTKAQADLLCRAAEFLDACAGVELEQDGICAMSIVEDMQAEFLPEDWDDCFHIGVRRLLEAAPSASSTEGGEEDEGPCTDCWDTGITIQTERRCACQPPLSPPGDERENGK